MPAFGRHVLLSLTLAVAASVADAAAVKPVTFEAEFVVRTPVYGVVQKATLTTKGHLMRYRQRTGAGLRLQFIRNHQGTFHMNEADKTGAKWPASWAHHVEKRLMTGGPQGDPWVFLKAAEARRTGRQTVDGRPADVWTYNIPNTSGKPQVVRVYMDVKERRPLKAEFRAAIAPGRTEQVTIEYKTYRWNFPLPDSYFDVPREAKLVDLGNPKTGPSPISPGATGSPAPTKPAPMKKASAAVDTSR